MVNSGFEEKILAESHSSPDSVHSWSTKIYQDLKKDFFMGMN